MSKEFPTIYEGRFYKRSIKREPLHGFTTGHRRFTRKRQG